VGILHRPEIASCEIAVLVVVGGPQYRIGSHRQFVASARALAAAGYPVLRFDYRGMGDSEGEYTGFEGIASDIRAAVDALYETCNPRRGVVVLGLCDAASAALMYCCQDSRVMGLILMNPWVRSAQSQAAVMVKRYYAARLLQGDFWRKLASGGLDLRGSVASLWRNLRGALRRSGTAEPGGFIGSMRSGLDRFRGPVLLVQSGRDLTADEFRVRCRSDAVWSRALMRDGVEVVDLAEADHTFSSFQDLEQFNGHCARWLGRSFGGVSCR
jgi:exosortase A-associated hydrolase 1